MYENYYRLTGKPFQLNPDPRFYFESSQHRRAMAFVQYGLHQAEGFIVVTGEVGAGKTTLLRNVIAQLDPERVVAAHLVSTQLDAEDTLRMVAASFGVRTKDQPKAELLLSLEALLAAHTKSGRRCLLIVDEAQNLTQRAVEELRMLSNFQLGTHALLQTFLVGQPEFRLILQSAEMAQLCQRVIAACHIGPLNLDETRQYIEHRLKQVGWRNSPVLLPDAYAAIHEASGGVPRRINLLCDRLLLSGYLSETNTFNAQTVAEVSAEIRTETGMSTAMPNAAGSITGSAAPAPRAAGDRSGPYRALRAADALPAVGGGGNDPLVQIERGMKDFEATLQSVEPGSQEHAAIFRRMLEVMRRSLPAKEPNREE